MLFNSLHFLAFFPIVVVLYYTLPARFKWVLLLVASYYFYMSWKAVYILLIVLSTFTDYFIALAIDKTTEKLKRKLYLWVSLVVNLGLLVYFKYFNFFIDSINETAHIAGASWEIPLINIILPVGISFYTFQTLSYTLEVYYGRMQPERNFGRFALYVSFFPQLVAGPIERPQNLLPQLNSLPSINYERITSGLRLMLWGMFKKIVIADRLASFTNEVFNHPTEYHGLSVAIAAFFFTFQIYCDFSGYSDIAIGTARVLGVDLMKNFNTPYFAKSIKEFWSRWHISLSTWFRDYVYIPLGGNRTSVPRWVYNLFITFMISGIWHGANWTFVIWGFIHGVFISVEALISRYKLIKFKPPAILANLFTFFVVYIAWIFFRANNVGDAFTILKNLTIWDSKYLTEITGMKLRELFDVLLPIPLIVLLLTAERVYQLDKFRNLFFTNKALRVSTYIAIILLIAFFGAFRNKSDFIYFQF